jgi:hypothetical protein
MQPQRVEGSSAQVNEFLRQLFDAHGVQAVLHSGIVRFPSHRNLAVSGEIFKGTKDTVQLDVRLVGFDRDRQLVESTVGLGKELNAQALFALKSFANSSFHVWLTAFFDRPESHGTKREEWMVGGRTRPVYPGLITTVLGFPPQGVDGLPDMGFYPAFVKRLETTRVPAGIHWIRVYQMRHRDEMLANEVLLDNEPWEEVEEFFRQQSWPAVDKPYDVRMFLVVSE